jgi:hypothetical protein
VISKRLTVKELQEGIGVNTLQKSCALELDSWSVFGIVDYFLGRFEQSQFL